MVIINGINGLFSGIPTNLAILFEIGIMIVVAGIMAFIFRIFKQPKIPAYIIAGIILGPLAFGVLKSSGAIIALSEIGVAFLLFFVGLEIDLKNLKRVGRVAIITGIIEMVLMAMITILILLVFNFRSIELAYIALVVAFSSTMVVVKLIADKEELNTIHGRIILGILLIQDIIAILAITILTTDFGFNTIIVSLSKALLFLALGFILAKASTPILRESAKSNELMLLIPLSFLFLYSIGAYLLGLSLVVGAFFAGVALANSPFKIDIKGHIHPLRDFFGAILFVSLGMQLVWIPREYWGLFWILMSLIIIIKPLVLIITTRLMKYTNRTAFFTGNSLGQASEFGLIFLTQALMLSHINKNLFSVLVFATIISMSVTSYFIKYEHKLYKIFSYPARIFKRIPTKEDELAYGLINKGGIVLIGCHRMGTLILQKFSKINDDILVIDFNPDIIKSLIDKKIPCIYGDYANPEIMQKISKLKPETIISTIPDKDDNINLIEKLRRINRESIIIVVAERIHEAMELYKKGADYVILPKVISGVYIDELIDKIKRDKKTVKKKEIEFLNKIHYYLYKEK